MPSWDVRLLTSTYSAEGDGVVVELYGKTREGRSIVVRHRGFRPYFHMLDPPEATRRALGNDPEVVELKDVDLRNGQRTQRFLRVTIKFPWKVPQYRDRYRRGTEFFAADIPFGQRFVYDLDLGACVRVIGAEAQSADRNRYAVELVVEAERYEECPPFHPPLKILSFDIENSIRKETFGRLFTICIAVRDRPGGDLRTRCLAGSEVQILRAFEAAILEEDPDVITGYNIDNYDIPTLLNRAKASGLEDPRWARDLTGPRSINERFWRLTGRVVADAWWNAKLALRPKKETLAAISRLVLDEEKLDVDPLQIDAEWAADREKVQRYCTRDAELALRILERINILKRSMDLAAVSRLPLDDVVNGRTSTLIDSILIRQADRAQIAVPMTRRERSDGRIEGGYVHKMSPGLYHWVCVLDFKSMYPSVIISKNICFTTLSPEGRTASPVGARFLTEDVRAGLLPRILRSLMKDRADAQRRRNEARQKGTREEADYYDGLQEAVKVLMNSVYGVFASAFYRFTNQTIGASITAFARENIKDVIERLEGEGLDVIYSDTDSVFFLLPEDARNPDGAVRFGKEKAEEFSRGGATLEFQGIYEPMFTHGAKKRYVARSIWPKEDTVVRGYEIRRTDSFDLLSESLSQVFDQILAGRIEEAKQYAKGIVSDTKSGRVAPEKLVISRTVQGVDDEGRAGVYKNPDSMANVATARKLKAKGYDFVPGMKVSWIVTDADATPQQVEPYIDGRPFEHRPDWKYYARRLAVSLSRATEIFGLDERALLTGQQGLDSFAPGPPATPRGRSGAADARGQKTKSLDEFM
ncbi:MAG: DNA polymerase II [Euryarchaeota archaeon]|nr:DNA polymerase II [Euryarchaeota archaeon]